MKTSAIEDMYYNRRGSSDFIKPSDEFSKQMDAVIDCDNVLTERLTEYPEILTLYENFKEAIDEAHCTNVRDYYKEGFSFGLLMGIEAESRS